MFHKNTSRFVYRRKVGILPLCASALREHVPSCGSLSSADASGGAPGNGDGPGPLTQSLSIDKQGGERG